MDARKISTRRRRKLSVVRRVVSTETVNVHRVLALGHTAIMLYSGVENWSFAASAHAWYDCQWLVLRTHYGNNSTRVDVYHKFLFHVFGTI